MAQAAHRLAKLPPLSDAVFHRLFKDLDLLKSLLNALLHLRGSKRIASLQLINARIYGHLAEDKDIVLDLRAQTSSGKQFHVEVQLRDFLAYAERMLFYWAGSYHGQLPKGASYGELNPVVSVHLLGFRFLPDEPRFASFHHVFDVTERRTHHRLSDHLELHTIEIPKFHLTPSRLRDPEQKWVYYLVHGHKMTLKTVEALDMPEIKKADDELWEISQDRQVRVEYERRLKAELDARSWKKDHIDKAERDKREAVAKAMVQAAKDKRKAVAHAEAIGEAAALRHAIASVCEILAISMGAKRKALLKNLDAAALRSLLNKLKKSRSWPDSLE